MMLGTVVFIKWVWSSNGPFLDPVGHIPGAYGVRLWLGERQFVLGPTKGPWLLGMLEPAGPVWG